MADQPDPYDLVPPHLRLTDPRALSDEAALLARCYKNGHLRTYSQAAKRQWLHRVCCVLEEYSGAYYRINIGPRWNDLSEIGKAWKERERALAEVRGEPKPPEDPLFPKGSGLKPMQD